MRDRQLVVESVSPASIAEEMGIEPGDIVLHINKVPCVDIIDYRFLSADEEVNLLLQKPGGDCWLLEIEKDWDEDLGLSFANGGLGKTARCRNNCLFCFVDQMPPAMRDTLYVKDDDYRLSFIQGNFITLTNLREEDLQRIARLRLSPLYVSVHTVNPDLRRKMMGNPRAAPIMDQLRFLAGAGIKIHTQAVLCPGINDGDELDKTMEALASLWPAVTSLALVPVGLTRQRKGLYPLRTFKKDESREIVKKVRHWQQAFTKQLGYPLVFAADEFYHSAREAIPSASSYGGFPQTENGVGLTRLFLDDWQQVKNNLPGAVSVSRRIEIVTGAAAYPVLTPVADRLNQIENTDVRLNVVRNRYFGPEVTVAGLLTAKDIAHQVKPDEGTNAVIIPGTALRSDEPLFLDGPSLKDLSQKLGAPVIAANNPEELVNIVTENIS